LLFNIDYDNTCVKPILAVKDKIWVSSLPFLLIEQPLNKKLCSWMGVCKTYTSSGIVYVLPEVLVGPIRWVMGKKAMSCFEVIRKHKGVKGDGSISNSNPDPYEQGLTSGATHLKTK
jgi:hypothetical protein